MHADEFEQDMQQCSGRGKSKRKSDIVVSEALPPALEELQRVFTALNTVYGFLQRQRMQATWSNVKQSLLQLCFPGGDEKPCLQAVKDIAVLCPKASKFLFISISKLSDIYIFMC